MNFVKELATCYTTIDISKEVYKQRDLTSNLNLQLATKPIFCLVIKKSHHPDKSLNSLIKLITLASRISSQEQIETNGVAEHHGPDLCGLVAADHTNPQTPALPYFIMSKNSDHPTTAEQFTSQTDGAYLSGVNASEQLQSPDDIQPNDCSDFVPSTSHVAYDRVHYHSRRQMAMSTTEKHETHTASGDEVYGEQKSVLKFAMTTSSAVSKNKLVSGRVQFFLASTVSVDAGHIPG